MDDPGSRIFFSIFILLLLTAINAFFAMSEIAVLSSNRAKMTKLADGGDKRAQKLVRLTQSQSSFLSTIQVGITLSGFLASAVAADNFAGLLAGAFAFLPVSQSIVQGTALVIITLVLSYFSIVFGELIPKRLALRHADSIALSVAGAVWVFYRISRPFVILLAASTNGVLRLFGIKQEGEGQQVSTEDVMLLVEAGAQSGVFDEDEQQMIENIFRFDGQTVGDVMTHRTNAFMLDIETPVDKVVEKVRAKGFSRVPVFRENSDNIVGLLYTKDLLNLWLQRGGEVDWTGLIREPYFVPEAMEAGDLLDKFQKQKVHMAIVVDEYGGTAGIVTLEDLIEDIVGEIDDEYDKTDPEILPIRDGGYLCSGTAPLEDISETLGEDFVSDDYDTLAGYIIDYLGRIPLDGEQVELPLGKRWRAKVLEMEDKRLSKIEITPSGS